MHLPAPQFALAFFCALRAVVYAAADSNIVNVTVDDSAPDTGNRIMYSEGWSVGQDCTGCLVQPDKAEAHENSWHDTTYSVGVGNISRSSADATFNFTGTAVYVYGILCHSIYTLVTTSTHVNFSIDSRPSGTFQFQPTGVGNFSYNQLLFGIDSLPYGPHVLRIQNGNVSDIPSLLLLDYVEYTTFQEEASSSITVPPASQSSPAPRSQPSGTPTAPSSTDSPNKTVLILAIMFGILFGTLVAAAVIWYCIRRRRKIKTRLFAPDLTTNSSAKGGRIPTLPPSRPSSSRNAERHHSFSTTASLLREMHVETGSEPPAYSDIISNHTRRTRSSCGPMDEERRLSSGSQVAERYSPVTASDATLVSNIWAAQVRELSGLERRADKWRALIYGNRSSR